MKKHKVLSVLVIIGVVMLILGLFTTVIGFAAGGRIRDGFEWSGVYRVTTKYHETKETEDIDYSIKGDITAIDIDVSIGNIKIVPNSQNARVEARDYPKGVLSMSENAGTLTIRDTRDYDGNYSHLWEITIYISGSELNSAKIDTDVGNVVLDDITIGDADLDIDAGDLSVTNSVFNRLECSVDVGRADFSGTTVGTLFAELDAGDFEYSGDITKAAEINNNFGNVTLTLDGAESNYYFVYSIDLGNIEINNMSSSGTDREATYGSSNAPVKIDIDVDAGNIEIDTN